MYCGKVHSVVFLFLVRSEQGATGKVTTVDEGKFDRRRSERKTGKAVVVFDVELWSGRDAIYARRRRAGVRSMAKAIPRRRVCRRGASGPFPRGYHAGLRTLVRGGKGKGGKLFDWRASRGEGGSALRLVGFEGDYSIGRPPGSGAILPSIPPPPPPFDRLSPLALRPPSFAGRPPSVASGDGRFEGRATAHVRPCMLYVQNGFDSGENTRECSGVFTAGMFWCEDISETDHFLSRGIALWAVSGLTPLTMTHPSLVPSD
ncbi:MAG: hypothetical protein BJ554DRAFT_6779 [Olpidium bornovanus]|uniref:Uncharacterized protein n=1 Tax=Olpidium bornovanus TaxID=278681 RepID=A0A8H7ZXA7_9FUNG|nr:MAG: hypothetical protein BJ554DRAFT_6779 [Olpidium bornovanus]